MIQCEIYLFLFFSQVSISIIISMSKSETIPVETLAINNWPPATGVGTVSIFQRTRLAHHFRVHKRPVDWLTWKSSSNENEENFLLKLIMLWSHIFLWWSLEGGETLSCKHSQGVWNCYRKVDTGWTICDRTSSLRETTGGSIQQTRGLARISKQTAHSWSCVVEKRVDEQ